MNNGLSVSGVAPLACSIHLQFKKKPGSVKGGEKIKCSVVSIFKMMGVGAISTPFLYAGQLGDLSDMALIVMSFRHSSQLA